MFRIPSQTKAFKPIKQPRRSATTPSQNTQGSKSSQIPQSPPLSSQTNSHPAATASSTDDAPSTQAASQPSMPPPIIPFNQPTASTQSDDLPPAISSAPSISTSQIDPRVIVESDALARQRQTSAAPSTALSSRAGRPALIQAAAARTAAGEPTKRSKGRIPSRSAASRAASSTPGLASDAAAGSTGAPTVSRFRRHGLAGVNESASEVPQIVVPASPHLATSDGLPPTIATAGPASSAISESRASGHGTSTGIPSQPAGNRGPTVPAGANTAPRRAPRRNNNTRSVGESVRMNGLAADDSPDEDTDNHAGSSTGPGTQQASGRKRKAPADVIPVRRPTRVRRRAFLGADGTDQSSQSQLAISQKRGTYRSKGVQGTSQDGRLSQNKKKQAKGLPRSIPELSEVQAGDHVGDEVDIEETIMGALATRVTVGKVSARGLVLHEHHREITKTKNRERPKRIETAWKRKQVQRRKLRAGRNAERAERRRRFEEMGDDSADIVSDDEDDSEEEFEVDSEWLRNLDDEEDIRRGRQAREQNGDQEREDGEEYDPMEGDRQDDEGAEEQDDPDADVRSGEDEHDAALRASGFIVTQDRPRDEDGEEGEDNEEGDEDRDDDMESRTGVEYDLDAYRRDVEERRRRNLERVMGQGVVEENDELKMVNSASYGRRQASERWTPEDTDMFYVALAEVGPTPLYLNEYFRGRTHRQLKNKLNREAELDPIRFNAALVKRRRPDTAFINQNRGIDLLSPHEAEAELFESAALGKINAKRRDLGLPEEEPQNEVPMAEDVMPDGENDDDADV